MKKFIYLVVAGGAGYYAWRRFVRKPQWTDWTDSGDTAQDWVKNADGQWVKAGTVDSEAATAE